MRYSKLIIKINTQKLMAISGYGRKFHDLTDIVIVVVGFSTFFFSFHIPQLLSKLEVECSM